MVRGLLGEGGRRYGKGPGPAQAERRAGEGVPGGRGKRGRARCCRSRAALGTAARPFGPRQPPSTPIPEGTSDRTPADRFLPTVRRRPCRPVIDRGEGPL